MKSGHKKELFLKKMAQAFNITEACIAAGIGRRTYYTWKARDKKFEKALEDIQESLLDHVEARVYNAIDKDDKEMIKWYLSHKGKSRGYGEQVVQEHTGAVEIKIVEETVKADDGTQV